MIGERTNSPFEPQEETAFNNIISNGQDYKFTNQKGQEDCIMGLIELHWREQRECDATLFGYEEFKTKELEGAGKRKTRVIIEKVAPKFQKLTFKPDRQGNCIAMCPDTKFNRMKLARSFINNLWDYHKEHTRDGDKSGSVVMAEIRDLYEKLKAENEGKNIGSSRNLDRVDRVFKNLTEAEQMALATKLIDAHNKRLQPISTDIVKTVQSIEDMVGEIPPKPKGVKEYTIFKDMAKKIVFEKNKAFIEALKVKSKNIYLSKEYKEQIAPQITYVLNKWLEDDTVPAEMETAAA
jgi:hypothetical protein